MSAYSEASKAVFEVFEETTPLVEGLSIDEAFLDVGGLRAHLRHAAARSPRGCARCVEQVGLPITVGVARTKFLAKVASGVAKPDGLLVVPPDGELAFLHPLPVERLWGVGPVTAAKLHGRGHHHGRARSPSSPSRRWSRCSGGPPAGTCTRWPTTAIRGRCRRPARGVDRRAARARAPARAAGRARCHAGRAGRPGTRRMRAAAPGRPHGGAAAALRRLLPRDPLAHAVRGHRADRRRSWSRRGSCWRPRCR